MQFVTVRDLRSKSAEIWRRLKKEKEVIITSNGKPIAVLAPIAEGNLEESLKLTRKVRAMMAREALVDSSLKKGLNKIPLEEINAEIAHVRKERRA